MQSGAGSTFGFKSSVFFAILATSSNTTALWTASAASFPQVNGPIPCARNLTPEEIEEAYEKNTGLVIIETFETRGIKPMYTPAVLCKNHGP